MRHIPKHYRHMSSEVLIAMTLWTRGREQAAALAELEARGLQLAPKQQLMAGLTNWRLPHAHVPSETYAAC